MKKHRIVLGSSSPRRKELLKNLTEDFEIMKPRFEEKLQAKEKPADYVLRNALGKAGCIVENSLGDLCDESVMVIGADTIVHLSGDILQKPVNREEAETMLRRLSGQTHEVLTGVCVALYEPGQAPVYHQFLEKTQVTFTSLTDDDIKRYCDTGEPMDKAGAYGIQGRGAWMVEAIHGSYTNVVGLPMTSLAHFFRQHKIFT